MKRVALAVVAALAAGGMTLPAVAADMPVKAKPAEPTTQPSPFDVLFGAAFTSDYMLRGISQTNHDPAIQGYTELDFTAAPWLTLYAGLWGSNVSFADAEFDISGGARFSYRQFGLDVGYVYYDYPSPTFSTTSINYGEFYAKPSFKVTDWLTIGGTIIGGDNFGNLSQSAWYYEGNATITLPQFMPLGIGTSISGAVGRQTYDSTLKSIAFGYVDYTTWNIGIDFNYKAVTLDLRYVDSNIDSTNEPLQCLGSDNSDLCDTRFVATLKFDTSLSALK